MISLFRLFMFRMQSTKDGFVISKDVSPYILSENGEWKRASELVMSDRRFPDGFRNIIDSDTYYAPEQCAAYPAYLEDWIFRTANRRMNATIVIRESLLHQTYRASLKR